MNKYKYKLYEIDMINNMMIFRFIREVEARNIVEAEFEFEHNMLQDIEYIITTTKK